MSTSLILPPTALTLTLNLADVSLTLDTFSNPIGIIGQQRAQAALAFGVAMPALGYNIYVKGCAGSGRLSLIRQYLDKYAQQQATPCAYAYVDNFTNTREPSVLAFPAGAGQQFNKAIEQLIDSLLATFPAVFESPAYQQKKRMIERQFTQQYNNALEQVDVKAAAASVALFRDNEVFSFAPIRDGKALDDEQFISLSPAERENFHQQVEILEECLSQALLALPQWRRTCMERLRELDTETIDTALAPLFAELHTHYTAFADINHYLQTMRAHLSTNIMDILPPGQALDSRSNKAKRQALLEQYMPNIVVEYPETFGAPVVYEPHPSYANLFGRIEYTNEQGTLTTSYRRICSGALHKANGGYLIIEAEKLLHYPSVWESVKRALKATRLDIDLPYADIGINTITLKPQAIPLNVKIILLGEEDVYYALQELDSEFNELFHVLADVDEVIRLTPENLQQFCRLLHTQAQTLGFELTSDALARLIAHSCRLAESQQHLSARMHDALELIHESTLLTSPTNHRLDHVAIEAALLARETRNSRLCETMLEEILEGTVLIATEGAAIGKINGLTVMDVGNSRFGLPARITTTVYPGSRGIVDIEREAELGQSIHSKGVLILTGYLGHCYAQQFPLGISASIALEQSYGYIDGDSASLAELCCLISALTQVPIKQNLAVTGSINQYGEVQAVGGINEKIEGFFHLCQARGLTGEQGVIVPAANQRHLILKQAVIDAVRQNLFTIYAVRVVDEALGLLTGLEVGYPQEDGSYPEHTLNFKAISRLKAIADINQDADKNDSEGV